MQHIRRVENNRLPVVFRQLLLRLLIAVVEPAVFIPADGHLVRHQRIQRDDLSLAVADDLRIGVAPQQQVRHQRFPKDEGRHLRVRLIMQQQIQRVINSFLFPAVLLVAIHMQRQSGDRLRQNTHTGIHRRHLHGGAFRHGFARRTATHVESVT